MKQIIFTCDMCGKEIDFERFVPHISLENGPTKIIKDNVIITNIPHSYDLCEECIKNVVTFIQFHIKEA